MVPSAPATSMYPEYSCRPGADAGSSRYPRSLPRGRPPTNTDGRCVVSIAASTTLAVYLAPRITTPDAGMTYASSSLTRTSPMSTAVISADIASLSACLMSFCILVSSVMAATAGILPNILSSQLSDPGVSGRRPLSVESMRVMASRLRESVISEAT